jgi:D-galacturonate reductase
MSLGPVDNDIGLHGRPTLMRQVSKFVNSAGNNASVNVLMIGSGEYTTGYVNGQASDSDKGAGVVALTMLDLKLKGKTNRLAICGVNGKKFPGIRAHMHAAIGKYEGLDPLIDTVETYPKDTEVDPKAYEEAMSKFSPGDAVIIFTPDDTHFEIALKAIRSGLHVLVTKPAVKTLAEHTVLYEEAKKYGVLVCIEVHKRWDPIYVDARDKISALGPFGFMHSYMSQPKHQLETFRAWAGKSSDISYYLNSHHIDFHEWCAGQKARPSRVTAMASTGVAKDRFDIDAEDTITLTVEWQNLSEQAGQDGGAVGLNAAIGPTAVSTGTAVYTSSWVAPKSDVHSQQRFFYMGHKGEINVDQAHRGYNMADDGGGYKSVNPLFMKYTPTDGKFSGQLGYGYRSFEAFIDAVQSCNSGAKQVFEYDEALASVATTFRTTAILEAGRKSLDEKKSIEILYEDKIDYCRPTALV